MEKQHKEHNNGGFFVGLLLGAIITLLIATKKGRKLFRKLTAEGLDKFGEWEGIVKEVKDVFDEDIIEGDDYISRSDRTKSSGEDVTSSRSLERYKDTIESDDTLKPKVRSTARRFFRKTSHK